MAEPQAASVEDRILNKLMPEPEQPEPEEAEAEPEEAEVPEPEVEASEDAEVAEPENDGLEDYELEGAQYRVPKELKSRLEAGHDYARRNSELENVRRSVDLQTKQLLLAQERSKFDQSVIDDVKNLEMIEAYIKHQESQDWTKTTDTQRTNALMEMQQLRSRRDDLRKVLEGKWNEFQTKVNAERAKLKTEANDALSKAIPKWSEETRSAIEKYVVSQGYPEAALGSLSVQDYIVANKARQWDELQATKTTSVKKAAEKKGVVIQPRPRNPMPEKTKNLLNLRKAVQRAKTPDEKRRAQLAIIAEKFS